MPELRIPISNPNGQEETSTRVTSKH